VSDIADVTVLLMSVSFTQNEKNSD